MRSPLAGQSRPDWCAPFLATLPIDHAAISTLGDPFETETVCSSDPLAARLDELQLDYGEGPCWMARATGAPILIRDLRNTPTPSWPVLQEAIASHEIQSAYAFPLRFGGLNIGAVDLYATSTDVLSDHDVHTATALATSTAQDVLRYTMQHRDDPGGADPSSRRRVHQATGMVIAQLHIPANDALLLLRAHAFAMERSVADIAADVIHRRIDFSPDAPGEA